MAEVASAARADVVVGVGDDPQAGPLGGGGERASGVGQGGLGGGAVEPEDAAAHLDVECRGELLRCRRGHAERDECLGPGLGGNLERLCDPFLDGRLRLPDLGEVMPDVVGVKDADRVRGPGADEIRAVHGHHDDEATAPVVSEQVGGLAQRLKLASQPVPIAVRGDGKSGGQAARRLLDSGLTAQLSGSGAPVGATARKR